MKKETVEKIRQFNRYYMPIFNLLGNKYLNSEYTAAEARVLYEIHIKPGCTAAEIGKKMNLDKGYMSRVISKHEKSGYVRKSNSENDMRAYKLFLTPSGTAITNDFIKKSNAQISEIICGLEKSDCELLVSSLNTVMEILNKCDEKR